MAVVTDVTRRAPLPPPATPGHPVYYLPFLGGYRPMGPSVANEQPPNVHALVDCLAHVLAARGYIASKMARPKGSDQESLVPIPSLVLVINWGYLNPIKVKKVMANANDTVGLVAGNTLPNLPPPGWTGYEDMMQGAEKSRYFVTVEAFDFSSYRSGKRRLPLWMTKMSIPSQRLTMDQAVPALVSAGGPFFGRETTRPGYVMEPLVPAGSVQVGEPVVKGYSGDAPPPPPPASPAN